LVSADFHGPMADWHCKNWSCPCCFCVMLSCIAEVLVICWFIL
jgi:hypothetical protein